MKRILTACLATIATLLLSVHAYAAATLLPNGQQCFSATTGVTGVVGALGTITGGSGGTSGTYGGVALTGGSGSGATANVVVSGGAVTSVTILNPGTQYVVGDVLSAVAATIGNVTGFSVPINSVSINSSLASGTVGFYVPNTLTPKQTWQNAAQTVLNSNPATLDQNGCMIAYGTGTYRQILKDNLGNTIWDQITTDTSANNNTFWANVAGGTPNVITVVDAGFNATDGSIINFTALATNTSSATLNPSSFGAVPILKDTTAGPVALTGGEIVASNPISVIYRASDGAFHLLNTVIASASGATAPLCGATGLKITNSASSPNTIINLTARQIVMQTNAGLVINRSNVSLTAINISTGTSGTPVANGMDGEAPGTSAWLDIFVIDNGAAPAGLVSVAASNGLSPAFPSGYTYKCYLGAMRVDGSGNLYRTIQYGNQTSWVVATGVTNNANLPIIASGAVGSVTVPTWVTETLVTYMPPTAFIFDGSVGNGATNSISMVAPNNSYGAYNSTSNPPPVLVQNGSALLVDTAPFEMVLEGTISNGIYFAGQNTSFLLARGWKDQVNAN